MFKILEIVWIIAAGYSFLGLVAAIRLRWNDATEGVDLLLDVILWPLMLYFWLRYGR